MLRVLSGSECSTLSTVSSANSGSRRLSGYSTDKLSDGSSADSITYSVGSDLGRPSGDSRASRASDLLAEGQRHNKFYGNYNEAFKSFHAAADLGSRDAHYELAKCYQNGRGVNANNWTALGHYEQASHLGNPDAAKSGQQLQSAVDEAAQPDFHPFSVR